jgi:hypothetical protein
MSLVQVAFFGATVDRDTAPRNDDLTSGGRTDFRQADPVEDQEL